LGLLGVPLCISFFRSKDADTTSMAGKLFRRTEEVEANNTASQLVQWKCVM
jgi:hypothetical protein